MRDGVNDQALAPGDDQPLQGAERRVATAVLVRRDDRLRGSARWASSAWVNPWRRRTARISSFGSIRAVYRFVYVLRRQSRRQDQVPSSTTTAISGPRLAAPLSSSRSPLQNRPGSNQFAGVRGSSRPIRV